MLELGRSEKRACKSPPKADGDRQRAVGCWQATGVIADSFSVQAAVHSRGD